MNIIQDKRLVEIFKRIDQETVITNCELARAFGRLKKVRKLRQQNRIYIGNDRKKNVSIIFKK